MILKIRDPNTNQFIPIPCLQGPQGPQGVQGPQGEPGMPEPIYVHYIYFNYIGANDGSFQINFIIINNEEDSYSANTVDSDGSKEDLTPDIAYQSYRLWNALDSIKPSGPIGVSGSRKSSGGQMYMAQSIKAYIQSYDDGDEKRLITLNSTGLSNNSNFGEDTVDFSCGLIQDTDGTGWPSGNLDDYCHQKFTIVDSVIRLA